jgi:hypothetical protein
MSRKRKPARLLAAVLAGAGLAFLPFTTLPASAAPTATGAAAAAAKATIPSLEVCGTGPAVRTPASVIITCADSGMVAGRLRWKAWTSAAAAATGTVGWKENGRSKSATADITLSAPAREAGGKVLFTKLTMRVTGATPRAFIRTATFNEAPVPAVGGIAGTPKSSAPARAGRNTMAPAAAGGSGSIPYASIAGYWELAGGPDSLAETAAAITGAEAYGSETSPAEGGNPGAIQPGEPYSTTGWGLWQITPGDSEPDFGIDYQMLDPWDNANAAVQKYETQGLGAWTTYMDGDYTNFLSAAEADPPNTNLTDPGQFDPTLDYGTTPNGSSSDPGEVTGPPLQSSSAYLATIQDNDTQFYAYENGTDLGTNLGMDPGNPATVGLADGGGYLSAFQANDTSLYIYPEGGNGDDTHLGMDAGTSPAVAALSTGAWEAAFQDNDNALYLYSSAGTEDNTKLGMYAGTSPSIAGSGGGWIAAFEANNSNLYIVTSAGVERATGLGMMAGTSPSITALANGGFVVAFQANTGNLYLLSSSGTSLSAIEGATKTATGLGMDTSTSPAIASYTNNSWQVAFQSNDNALYLYSSAGTKTPTTLGMDTISSPSIAAESGGTYEVAFTANNDSLYLVQASSGIVITGSNINTQLGMLSGTSPSIAAPYL